MGMNVGYLTAGRGPESDECMTPFYACEPLLKYIPKDWTIWCPCDEEWSAYYNIFKENGYNVIRSSIKEGQDFFEYEPDEHYDCIITNPPFSKKDKILKRLDGLGKPFAILLPREYANNGRRQSLCKRVFLQRNFAERFDFGRVGKIRKTAN